MRRIKERGKGSEREKRKKERKEGKERKRESTCPIVAPPPTFVVGLFAKSFNNYKKMKMK